MEVEERSDVVTPEVKKKINFFFEVPILQMSISQFGFLHKMSCFLRDSDDYTYKISCTILRFRLSIITSNLHFYYFFRKDLFHV